MTERTDTILDTTERSFTILEATADTGGATLTELAEQLGLPKSSVHEHLRTLDDLGYIINEEGNYYPALGLLKLGHKARARYGLYRAAKAEVDELVKNTGERAQVMVEEDCRGYYIYQTQSDQAITTDSHIGTEVDLHSTAVGKSYLAFVGQNRAEEIIENHDLKKITENTISDRERLFEELKTIREQGYALNREERLNGMRAVGAPIINADGHVFGSISVSGPVTRFDEERLESELSELVKKSGRVIGVKTTYTSV